MHYIELQFFLKTRVLLRLDPALSYMKRVTFFNIEKKSTMQKVAVCRREMAFLARVSNLYAKKERKVS